MRCQKYEICLYQMCCLKLQMHQNPFSAGAEAGALPRTPLAKAPPLPIVGWGRDTPPHAFPPSTLLVSPCRFLGSINKTFRIYAYVVREEEARMIFLQGGLQFEVTPLGLYCTPLPFSYSSIPYSIF